MSYKEKSFIYWFAFIAASLIIASSMGIMTMYRNIAVMAEKQNNNNIRVTELYNYHNKDVELIRQDIRDIRNAQKEIKQDIKIILQKVRPG